MACQNVKAYQSLSYHSHPVSLALAYKKMVTFALSLVEFLTPKSGFIVI